MYSMFDLLFETPSYRTVYVISDSEMKELKKNQHQEELNEITNQKVKLEDAFKVQIKHLEEREKEVKKELRVLSASKNK
ncbi:hypothetical protein OAZ97_00225 [Prochlorococcus sp. AH-736-E15]|nr:hypothetical protein [Prochlorococcus sp. AH-736-E15]